jgi:hypothetical protein
LRSAGDLAALLLAGVLPVLAYLGIGAWIARALGRGARGSEALAEAYVFGCGAASLALLALGALAVPVPLIACAVVAAAGMPALRSPLRARPADPEAGAPARRTADAVAVVLAAFTFLAALGPETYWDGFEYHLPIVGSWAHGGIRALPGWLDAELRAGVDLLYLPALAAGQPDAAAAVSAGFAAALAAGLRAEVARRVSPLAGSLAACFALGVPIAVQNAASSNVDLGVGAFGFLALLESERWSRTRDPRHLWASALCAGFAANAKLHAAVLAPAVLAIVAFGGARPAARQLARCAALYAAVVLPWFLKAALTTGNPLFPLFAATLGSGPFDPLHVALRQQRLGTDYPVARDAAGFVTYLVSLTFGRNVYSGGLVGPLPLALGVLALGRLPRATAVLAATLAALFSLSAVFTPALRFSMPLLPFLGVAAAAGGARLAASGRSGRVALALALAAVAALHGFRLVREYAPRVLALRDPHAYERAAFPDQDALRRVVAQGDAVVAIPMGAALWMDRPVYLLHWERNGELFFDPVRGHWTPPDAALALLRRRGVRSLAIDVAPDAQPGALGHPTLDAWLSRGVARVRDDVPRLPARGGREWRLVDLVDSIDHPTGHR